MGNITCKLNYESSSDLEEKDGTEAPLIEMSELTR